MRHHTFGVHANADAVILLAGLLKQMNNRLVLTEAGFEYPHKFVSVKRTIVYRPEYRVVLQLFMHSGYHSMTGGDPGRHKLVTVLGGGQNVARMPVPSSARGHVFGLNADVDYRMVLAAMVRRLGGYVALRESDFPMGIFVGSMLFVREIQQAPLPLRISLHLSDRGNVGTYPAMQIDLFKGVANGKPQRR